jgi:hypothetical protein
LTNVTFSDSRADPQIVAAVAPATATSSSFTYDKGYDTAIWNSGTSKPDYTKASGKLIATAVLKPTARYTFAGYSISNTANKDEITALFTNGTFKPSDVKLAIDGRNLKVTLEYPISEVTLTSTQIIGALGDGKSGAGGAETLYTAKPVAAFIATPSSWWTVGTPAVLGVTVTPAITLSAGADPASLMADDVFTVTLKAKVAGGYKFALDDNVKIVISNAIKAKTVAAAIAGLDVPVSDITMSGDTLTVVVNVTVQPVKILVTDVVVAKLGDLVAAINSTSGKDLTAASWNTTLPPAGITATQGFEGAEGTGGAYIETALKAGNTVKVTITWVANAGYVFDAAVVSTIDNLADTYLGVTTTKLYASGSSRLVNSLETKVDGDTLTIVVDIVI